MPTKAIDTVILKTPAGHEVVAEFDYEQFEVRNAKLIDVRTGIIKPLNEEISDNLARALHAKQIYDAALEESRAVEAKLSSFGEAVVKLGDKHPALAPYWREMEQHRTIAKQMGERARYFHNDAMQAIDKMADD